EYYFSVQYRNQEELQKLYSLLLSQDIQSDRARQLHDVISSASARCKQMLESLIEFPPRHIRHFNTLKEFWERGSYDQSVFIMTKFPNEDGDKVKNEKLE